MARIRHTLHQGKGPRIGNKRRLLYLAGVILLVIYLTVSFKLLQMGTGGDSEVVESLLLAATTCRTSASALQALKEQHAQETARLEEDLRNEKATTTAQLEQLQSMMMSPTKWDQISFQTREGELRNITGTDVRDLSVPPPRNLHLALAGDSLTRYQYLSLAYFLRYGSFPDPSSRPNFVVETTHASWMDFYNHTNSGLLPFERCDCYRPETKSTYRLVTEVRENRYYYDPISGNSLVYLMKWGWHKMTLSWEPHTIHQGVPPQYTSSLPNVLPPQQPHEGDWHTVLDHLAGLVPKPQVVVINAGLWKAKELMYPQIQDEIVAKLKQHNMIGIYKTTTKRLGDDHPTPNADYEKSFCKKLLCLDSSWTDYVSPSMYWDNLHFVEPIYKRLNIQLLQLLEQQNLLDTYEPKFVSPVLAKVKPLYGVADDDPNNNTALPHPHAGARFADGKLGLVANPDPARMSLDNAQQRRLLVCPEGPFPGVEESGGYDALQKVRTGLLDSKQFLHDSKPPVPRILCVVYTHAGNHDRIRAIANTWGKDCDGFLVASNQTDHTIGAIHLLHQGDEHYDNMWQKVRSIWAYVFDYYKDDYDYFHLCGDDVVMIPDNLRAYAMSAEVKRLEEEGYLDAFHQKLRWAKKASKVRPRPLLLGAPHYRSGREMLFPDGGPGYTVNRAALVLFGEYGLSYLSDLRDPREDVFVGSFFRRHGIFVTDTRDSEGGARYIDTDLDHQSRVDGRRWLSRLQPPSLERVFNITWTYRMGGISAQTIAIHLKWSNFAEDMPGLIYRYYQMLHYDQARCNVVKEVA